MVTVREHSAGAAPADALANRPVDVTRRRDLEAPHALRQRRPIVGLDEQVDVVALDRHMDDPEVIAPRCGERRLAHRVIRVTTAQVLDPVGDPERHVDGVSRIVDRSGLVPLARPRTLRGPTCPPALAAAGLQRKLGLSLLARPRHSESIPQDSARQI